ncbi:glycosyltransferase family 2 protein [Deltaproteobacteria bacterium IMCC39524]|nr:glycosyltransferase family 2 protein [Deltaproteobacteria bacterium IMCC39524]
MLEVSIVIVNYNTREMTLECLNSVFDQTRSVKFEIIVVDNNSNDGSFAAIKKNYSTVHLVESKENLGFARANNLASKYATGKYLLLLNPDTVILDGAIEKLVTFAESNGGESIYGGRTLNGKREIEKSSCWGRPTPWSFFCYGVGLTSVFRDSALFNPEAYGNWQRDTVRNVDIVSGCFLLIRKSMWDGLGGFDPKFFMYGEEADLCMRAKNIGVQPIICPRATIVHYGGASEKVRADMMVRLFKGKISLIQRHWLGGWVPFGVFMYMYGTLLRYCLCSIMSWLSKNNAASVACWKEIWQRRDEWKNGYQ